MATNDLVLLNQLLDQRFATTGNGLSESEYFELFSSEQVLKDDDLSYDELESGLVDGGGDGGIDSVYFFVNGNIFNDDVDIVSIKKPVTLRLVLIQSKKSASFKEVSVEKLISSAADLFDLTKDIHSLVSVYNEKLLSKIKIFRDTFLNLASKFPTVEFRYAYVAKAIDVHPNVERKVAQLEAIIKSFTTPVTFEFEFVTAAKLLANARRAPATASSLKLSENPISTGQEGFVSLVSMQDYFRFITDENGNLRAHLFEGNVRDYQGSTEVNKEIKSTLESASQEDFWWLNNGVTVICTNASLSGKTLTIEDAEIVNGLQTSREIFHSFQGKATTGETRNILVRVIKPQSQESRDRIIKATNSQTPIPPASLRATDKIHRDIEEFLYPKGFFYDRRKNYFKNAGRPINSIFGIAFMAQSVIACLLREPANARARPSSLIKADETYLRIFDQSYPLDVYHICPAIVRSVETELKQSTIQTIRNCTNNIKFYVSMLCVQLITCSTEPSFAQVAAISLADIDTTVIVRATEIVMSEFSKLGGTDQVAKGTELTKNLINTAASILSSN